MSSRDKTSRPSSRKNVPEAQVSPIVGALSGSPDSPPLAFTELARLCRDPEYPMSGGAQTVLLALGLITIEYGRPVVNEVARSLVLAATEGSSFWLSQTAD